MLLRKKYIVFALLSVFVVLLITNCGNNSEDKVVTDENHLSPTYLNHGDSASYVGMEQCRLCHQSIYNSFIETGMGKSFDAASKQKSAAKFDKHTVVYDKFNDFYYHPFWDKDSFKIMEFRLKGKDTVYKRIEKVDFIIGSGQHTNSHIQNVNGYFNQMPLTFYTQQQRWDLPPGFENGFNTRFSRKIGLECMSCHNSFPNFIQGSENKYETVPNGITCERCHGPGSIHVKQRSSGTKIDTSKYIDYSIVNPGKLPIDLQFDVCQRCHLQGNTVLKDNKSFYDFRPGMKLSDYMVTFLPRYKNADDEFIMASHADRLKQSKCFINSYQEEKNISSLRPYKNALTCVTCHNPHVSVKNTQTEVFNNACKNCHNPEKTKLSSAIPPKPILCSEKTEMRIKKNDNCVSCHMPKSGSVDIPHVTVHDHYIRKPLKKQEQEKIKTFIGLYAINDKNPSSKIKAKAYIQQYDKFEYKAEYLDSARKYLSDKTTNDVSNNFQLLVHINFIQQNFNQIIAYVNKVGKEKLLSSILTKKTFDNEDAWTAYRVGEAFYSQNNLSDAFVFYKKSVELAPFNFEFQNKLGVVLMDQNKYSDAIVIFENATAQNPKYIQILNNLGYAYLLSGQIDKAEYVYNKALKLDPDYELLLMNIAGLHIYKKQYAQAIVILDKVISKNPQNKRAKEVLLQLKQLKK
jgi:tetratricopeptide (TPR) repeat protein